MSKKAGVDNIKQIEEQLKPILEGLTLNVLKKKPDNIVSYINFYFNQPLFMIKYLQDLDSDESDLTEEQKREMKDLEKELEKYQEMELIEKTQNNDNSGSED